MARSTSLFSKVKGSLGELVFSSDSQSTGSVARSRSMLMSIPKTDYSIPQWKMYAVSKFTALIFSQAQNVLSLNRSRGLLPGWQSVCSGLFDFITVIPLSGESIHLSTIEGQTIIPGKQLHFPNSGETDISFGPDIWSVDWSTELGSNGRDDDIFFFGCGRRQGAFIAPDGSIFNDNIWLLGASAERQDGYIEIDQSLRPVGESNLVFNVMFVVRNNLQLGSDSASMMLLLINGAEWDFLQ